MDAECFEAFHSISRYIDDVSNISNFSELIHFLQLAMCRVEAVNSLPVMVHILIFCSFVIIGFIESHQSEKRVLLKSLLEGVTSVAYFITDHHGNISVQKLPQIYT